MGPDEWTRMAALVEKRSRRNPRGNVVITHGFSGQYMRQKRDLGGCPGLAARCRVCGEPVPVSTSS